MKQILKCLPLIGILMLFFAIPVKAETIAQKFSGRIFLQVESKGEAWYINPADLKRCYLGRPEDAFKIMRELAVGISNKDLDKLPVAGDEQSTIDKNLLNRLLGKIVLQVEDKGQAYYIDPVSKEAIYLGRPKDAFEIMRGKGTGISNDNLEKVVENPKYNLSNSVVVSGDNNTVSNNSTVINKTTNITDNSTVINNSGDNSSAQINQSQSQTGQTQTDPKVVFSPARDLENKTALSPGATNVVLFAFKIKTDKLIKINSIKIYHHGFENNIMNLGLYENSTGVLLGSKVNTVSSDGTALFSGLNKTLEGEETFLLKGDISSNAYGNATHVFKILSNSQIEVSPLSSISGLPIENGGISVQADTTMNISRSADSLTGQVAAGSADVKIAEFNLTSAGDDMRIKELSLAIDRSSLVNDGGAISLRNVRIMIGNTQIGIGKDVKEGDGSTPWTGGTIFDSFGSALIVPIGQTKTISIHASFNSDDSAFQNNETIKVYLLAGNNNAVGVYHGAIINTNSAEGNALTIKNSTITLEKYSGLGSRIIAAGSTNEPIGSFVIRADLVEAANLTSIDFKPLAYAGDYGILTIKDHATGKVFGTAIPSSTNNFTATLSSPPSVGAAKVINIVANVIAGSPESAGLEPHQGLVISKVTTTGTTSGLKAYSYGELVLQNTAIAPLN